MVGWSYRGMVMTGVAEQVPERLAGFGLSRCPGTG